MQRSFVYVLGFAALWAGCERDRTTPARPDAGIPMLDAGTDAGALPNAPDAGAPAQESATAQCDAPQCERRAAKVAESLTAPAEVSLSVKGGDCARVEIVGVIAGMACTCLSSNGWIYIGPEGAGCFARGRAGDCLWDDSEFEPCTVGDPSCATMCDELNKRYAADAAHSFDVEVRYSTCQDDACHHVLRIEDACYADYSFESGRRFDCKLSDAEILERDAKARSR